jgi:aminoglycoside phosphotransferase (APT) family kinase protein
VTSAAILHRDTEFVVRLTAYLENRLPRARGVRVENLVRYPSGASKHTWSADVRWEDDAGETRRGLVVRCSPIGAGCLDTAPDIEFNLYRRLWGTAVPVPKVLWLEEDPAWLGMPFYVMERIDGATTDMMALSTPAAAHLRPALARRLAEILAATHTLDPAEFTFLGPVPAPAACAPRELDFWHEVLRQEATEPRPGLEAVFRWLRRHLPPPAQRVTVVHGDFRNGNYLYNEHGILAMLDWEMVHLGDPLEDVGWLYMMSWRRMGTGPPAGIVPWEDWCRWYEERSGIRVDVAAVRFWEVFSHLKLAIIMDTGGWRFSKGLNPDILQGQLGIMGWRSELAALELIDLT